MKNYNYNFKKLLEDLRHGREIEFSYNNSNYSITVLKNKGWEFCKDNKQVGNYYENPVCLAKICKVEDMSLEELFNNEETILNNFYIL